jgi:hypothetical protein
MPETLSPKPASRPAGLVAAAILVFLEALVILGIAGYLLLEIIGGQSKSIGAAVSLFLLVLLGAAWIGFAGRGLLLGRRWARSTSVFWQLVQLAIASASFDGRGANSAIGVSLIVPSVIVIWLLFTKKVVAATRDEPEGYSDQDAVD